MTFTVLKSIKVLNPKTYFNDISDVVICNDKIFSICKDFENKTKHLNYIFSLGNDFIYEYFNYDNHYLKLFSKNIFKQLDKNIFFKKLAIKFADKGIRV